MEKGYYGAIEKYSDKDYLLAGSELNLDFIKDNTENFWKNKIAYNQFNYKETKSMCTIYAGVGILSNYFNYKVSLETFLELKKEALKDGFVDGVGWWIYKAVDLVRNWHNKNNPENKVITYKVETGSDLMWELLKKGYHFQTGFKGNFYFTKDKNDDCILQGNSIGNPTYGHSIYFGLKDNKLYTIDSNAGAKCQVYEVPELKEKIKNGIYFKYGYFYIPKKNIMNQLQKDIQAIEKALKEKITYNKKELEDIKKGKYTVDNRNTIKIMRAYKKLEEKINSKLA